MTTLPILTTCDSCCGACCREQGSPPGYLWLLQLSPEARGAWPDQEDVERIENLPREALSRIRRYSTQLMRGEVSGEGPCIWLNQQTGRCRFYEHRPQICRDFDADSDACNEWRKKYEGNQP